MIRLGVLLCFAACGRIDFGDRAYPCAPGSIAPDPVTISGTAYEFTSFDDTTQPVSSVAVTLRDAQTQALLAQATTDAQGRYTVTIATGGTPPLITSTFAAGGYLTTTEVPVLPIDRDEVMTGDDLWSVTDGPIWSDGSMDSVYGAAGVTRDQTKGNLNVAVTDCAGDPIGGATVAIDPAPDALEYLASTGPPQKGQPTTLLPFSAAVAFNAQPGPTHISVQAPGLVFFDQTVTIVAGEFVTLTVAQPSE